MISNETSQPLLLESALHLCVQRYNTTVTNGKTLTRQIGSSLTHLTHINPYNISVPGEPDTQYTMGGYSFATITDFLATVFRGRYTVNDDMPTYGSDAIEVFVDTLLVPPYDLPAMQNILTGVATSMTNAYVSSLFGSSSEYDCKSICPLPFPSVLKETFPIALSSLPSKDAPSLATVFLMSIRD
ncbi:MAG: hypothetical protein OHK93_002653 [Ramalina farinacea]|uniref:Uncharacterized protein n=1 Tax=Ramalina farinacea TaxID=258253 RepID=A0AA43TXF5_9LECA|nr:hypothetical protein [Ramalina farinacea]